MAAPVKANQVFTRGDTWQFQVVITSDEAGETPVNITGYTYACQVRTTPNIAAITATATCTVTDGPAGELLVSFAATVTDDVDEGKYYYDLQQTAGSSVTTIMAGEIEVLADVTR